MHIDDDQRRGNEMPRLDSNTCSRDMIPLWASQISACGRCRQGSAPDNAYSLVLNFASDRMPTTINCWLPVFSTQGLAGRKCPGCQRGRSHDATR